MCTTWRRRRNKGTSNPVCTQCSPCAEGDSFEVSACSATADTQCQSCTTSSDCDLNQYLSQPCTLSTDGVCTRCTQVGDCDSGFYLDGVCTETQDASCQPCHPSCTECEDGTAQGCTACPETLALDRIGFGNVGSCVSSCPPGQAEDVAANTCENCDSSCATCSAPGDATKCTSCTGVLFLTPSGTCSSSCPAGMYGNATTNTCVSCTACDTSSSYESSPCGGTDNRVCSDLTMCPPGTHVIQQPTATSDRRCGDCGEGTYQPASNQAICIVWAECHPQEQYESVAPTSTSNRVCTDLTECTPGAEFQLTAPTETSDRVCKALTTCKANQWQSMAPTATTDRQCTNLTVCAATEYQSMAPTDTSDRQCEPITQCQAHEYEKTAATPFSDAVCEAIRNCTQNEYQTQAPTATSNRACAPLTTCDFETQYISTPATPTSNRVCSALRSCFQHEFESQPPTTTTNRACTECAMCGSTQYERADCTANTNRVCEDLTQCKASQFEAVLATLTSDRECSNCTVCGDNSYTVSPCSNVADTVCDGCTTCPMGSFAAAACTATSDTDCQACATCDAGFFVSSPCTQGSNTQCTRCTTCQPDEYQQVACSASADALCQTITNCTQSQYQVSAPTATTNRVCSAVRECTAGQEYETQAPTATSNRACAPLTTCDFETQFESQAPTATSNRVCTPLSSCDAETQYETQAPTQTSDRECEGLATCVAGEFVATQPTPTSNRVCASCPAGTTDHDSDSETACVACPAGHFSSAGSIGPCSLYMCPAGTADTDNSASTPCEACDGTSSFQPAAGQAACLQATTCVAGEEEQDAPTAVSNRECRPCQLGVTYKAQPGQNTTCAAVRTCLAGEEQTLAPTLSSNRVCTTCGPGTFKAAAGQAHGLASPPRTCAPGFQESVVPTPASDRQCEACPTGTFKSTTGQATCTAHATCDTDTQYQTKAPTTSTNRECGPLTDCGTGEWEERAPTATSDRVCELCDSCEDEGLTQATACTETANTVCENCDTCSPGFFVSSPCTSVSQTECMECAECGADQYQTQECRVSTNTQCTPLTTCTASQYETVAPTDTSDRECAALTTCVVGQYECVVPTETSNRQCCAIAQCDVGEEEAVAPTATSNRQCQNCTAGTTDDDANGATPCVQCPAGTFVPEGRTGDCSAYRCAPGTVDADQLPSTACTPCSSGVSFAPTSGLTACVAVSDCPAGEEESVQPTLSSDRVCTVCAAGTFKEDAGQDDCMTASTCASGTQYVAQPHTPTSNTVCANVTQCTATQYQTVAPTTMSDRQCRNLTVCEANEYETRAPTATTDRQCATVRAACSMDEFESAAPTATSDRECTQLTTCRAQQYEARAPTPSTDRECIYWTNCTAAQFQVTAPTSVSDRVCANLTVCTATQFEAVAPTTTTNRVCEACTDCPGGTHYEMTPCTASADATCAMCSTCSGDTYASAACSETDDTTCTACTQCVDGSTFESSPCLAHDDRVCLPCTVCNVTEYIEQTCSATSDTQCLPYTTCDLDQFESQEPTRFQDRVCTQHTMCTPDVQYEIVAPTATTDRQCDDLSTCTAQQYISTAHTATSDRVCSALRQCTSSEFELVAPTTTSNRVCQRLTVCDPETEYESVPAGPARDRVCAPLTVCSPLEYESVAPTPTSNRQCEEQVLPPLSPLAIFSASGGLALTSETTYAESTSAQTAVLLQGTTNGEEGTGPVFSASVGEASTSASLETTRPAPAAVRFELAAAGTIYEDDPWVRGVLQVSTPANVVPRATAMDVTVRLDAENATSVSCTTNAHGLCSFALRVPRGWYTPGVDATANVTFAFQEAALQGAVAVQGQSSRLVTLASSAVFVPDNDVYVRLPNRDVRAGETLELEVLSRTAFPIASFAAVVTTSDDSRLRVNSLGLDFASWTGTSKAPSTTSAAVLGIASASARLSGPAGGDQLLFTISVSVPASATPGQASIDIILHSLDNAKGEGIRPGDRALPARVVFVDRQGADATNQGVVTVSGAQSQSIFAAPVSTLLAYTPTISGVAALHHVELFTMRESGGLEALDAADVTCSSSHPAVVDVTPTCHLKLGASSDLNAYAATITVTLDADAGVTTAFDVRVLRPALPVQLTVDDAELNAVTGWLDESSNCRQLYQKTRVRAFTSFSDDSGLVVDNIDVTKYVTMHVSNDGVATLSTPTHAGHDFAGVYVQGFQPGTVQVSTTVQGLASSVSVVVSSTPVVATRLDITPVVSLGFSPALPSELASQAALAATLQVSSTFTATNQHAPVGASVVLSDATRLELTAADGVRLVSDDAEVIEVQGLALVVRSQVQTASVPVLDASWSSGACAAQPIISRAVPVSLSLPTVASIAASTERTVLAAPDSAAAAAPFMHASSTPVLLTATLTGGARLDLDETDSLDIVSPSELAVTETSTGLLVTVASGAAPGVYHAMVTYETASTNISISVVDVAALHVTCRLHANGHTSQAEAGVVASLAPFQGLSPATFQACAVDVRGVLSTDGGATAVQTTDDVAASATISAVSGALAVTGTIVSVASPTSPVLGQAAVDVSVVGVTTQLTLTVSSTPVSVASATLTFPSQLRGLAQTTSVTPEAAVTFSDSSVFDSAAVLPAGLVEFMLEEPAPLGATGASASLLSAATGEVRLLGNSVERLSLFLVTVDATSPVVLAEASFACNLLPAEGEVDFGVNSGLALSGATAGSLLSFEVRANAGSADIDRLVFDVLFNASLVDFVTAGAGSDFVGAVNAFSSTLPQEEQAAFATHFVRVTAEPNAGVSGVPHIATITFTVKADTADEQVFFAGRVAAFTSRAGGAIAVGASESTPIVSPAASISTVIEAPSVMNRRRRRRRRDVATTACPTPPCAVCPNGDTHQTGDVNADCVFTLDDVTFFMDAYLETLLDPNYFSTLLPVQQEQLDADQDGTIGVLDVDLLSRVLSKDVRFVRDVMVQPVDTSNGCRLEVAVRVFGAGNVPALPGSTHVFFDVESMSAGFDTLFDASVVEVGQRINVDKGSSSLQGGLWQAAHLGGDVYGVVVRTPIASEDMHGITVFQLTSVNTTSGSGGFVGVSTDALSFTWSGPRVPPFNFAGYDFELTVPTMPPFQFVRTAGYNPFATFTNEQATASCHATTSCTASEYETAAPTATSSAECMPISTCDAEEYETEAPTATTDRECVNRTVCNVPVEYQSSAGNATADRTCTNVTVCLEGEIALLEPTPTSDRVCRLDAPCDYNMYESVPLTLTTDRVCLPVSECDPGFEETAAPTATSDRECSLIDYCANDPCQNNATCVSSTQLLTFVCNCPPGFTGTMCEYADACGLLGDQNPCAPGSQCVNDAGGIRCECALGQACGCCDGFTFLSCSLQTLPDTGSYCSDPATVAEDLDNLQSRQQQQSSATGESLGIIVGGVLGGLALLVLAVLAVTSLRRRSRDKSEALVKYEQDPFSGMLTSMRNPVFAPASQYLAAFKRVVCFSFLRYNKDLVLTEPAEELGTVYDILMVPRPPKRTLPTLKDDTNMFMEAKVSENERSLDEVVDFLSLALADLVMEEAIDTAAKEQSNGTRPYRANVPNDASGLIPKRWAAYLDPITGQVEEPAYEDASLLRGEFEDDEFAVDGSVSPLTFAQAERFLARRVTMRKSQMQRGGARDNAFVYDMGAFSGDDDNDETYSTANMGDEPERMYDVGSSDGFGEPVYDEGDGEGGVQDTYAFASNPAALDDLEDFADEEATYDMADADTQNAVRRGKSKKEIEAMYSRANKASVREPNYDNAAPGMPGEHDDDDYDSANNLGLSDEEEDGGPDYDNTLPSGTYDVRTMLTSGLNDDGDDDGAEPQYLGGNGSRRRGSEPEPVYDQGDGDVLGALPSFDEPDYDLGNEAPGAEESGERDPAYDMATAEGDSAGDTTGLMNTDPDYDIGDAPAQEEEGLVSELFDDEEEHEPTYAFSQPRNTSVRPRALRSLHGRTRPESLDGSSI
ncbi:hypothetical protein PTSG_11806 [Salpingoeca rosetta]|uniref:TNFR-Cys domain-containing protein n=1 Tax=Salpingoeca rosetta (strain ATCC 50818 / BSB-021) TaxID=946362 RepID=F2TZE5_SALR5|nr:uncharacterized protein PTSG_11806 [Salpingoeca rosetta]EGD78969.1 hypothetical protein PTSG_11806 [Salpingoeca rosetta]|eukprot:XP_004997925.1 hypothetical protein PTSG_11806 [Salpingoeca rosetta]